MLNPQPIRIPVATAPPEARGLARDQVRMLVSRRSTREVLHTAFRALPDFLDAGDLIVVNESGTLGAALQANLRDGSAVRLHLSTHLPSGRWVVEVRRPAGLGSRPYGPGLRHGQRLRLPAGSVARLMRPHGRRTGPVRLWEARLDLPSDPVSYLALHGAPIRYTDGEVEWPLRYYQTVFGRVPGSAEMASAGRPFSPETLAGLRKRGVAIAGLILHAGVSSLETGESPCSEWYRVPQGTAAAINLARVAGKRVLAIGTTVVRALESATDPNGVTRASEGWTDLVITPDRGLRGDLAMLTGFHEPESSHLAILEAVAGPDVIRTSYSAALAGGYLWHEFGDLHLIL